MVLDKPTFDRLYRGLTETHNWLYRYYNILNKGQPNERQNANLTMKRLIDQLGVLTKQFQQAGLQAGKTATSFGNLICLAEYLDTNEYYFLADKIIDVVKLSEQTGKTDSVALADYLDENGFFALANKVDEVSQLLCLANYGFVPKSREDDVNDANDGELIQPTHKGSLSTRYCPDHRGVQAIRVEENEYQCPIDGKKYNYEIGYINYEGQKVPGGSVANQTPATSNYGGIPMRIWDSRSDVLNRIN